MHVFDLTTSQRFDPTVHVEDILATVEDGDFTVASWEPGQCSPYHCHPEAVEAYLCFSGGGVMRTPTATIDVTPGAFVVHPPGELHEYVNGDRRSVLYRVRYGPDRSARTVGWRGQPTWAPDEADLAYLAEHPEAARLVDG